jgi:hypothetical protein
MAKDRLIAKGEIASRIQGLLRSLCPSSLLVTHHELISTAR